MSNAVANACQPAEQVSATIISRRDDNQQPVRVEIAGVMFRPSNDQAEDQRQARIEAIESRLEQLVGVAGCS